MAEFHPTMKPSSVFTLLGFALLCAPRPAALAQESKPPEAWTITVTRTTSSGAELSRVVAPMIVVAGHSYRQVLSLNMAEPGDPRLWRVNFHIELAGPKPTVRFEAGSLEILQTTYGRDNERSTDPVPLFASQFAWKGAGTYPLFGLDGDSVAVTFRPDSQAAAEVPVHKSEQVLELVRKDRSGKVLGKAVCPWARIDKGRSAAEMSLWVQVGNVRKMRLFSCESDEAKRTITVLAKDFSSLGDPVTVFVSDALLGEPTQMEVYWLDDQGVEARIRPGGGQAAE